MRFEPERLGGNGRIKSNLLPPHGFVATAMHLVMVSSARGNGEFIADLKPKRPALCKAQMTGIAGLTTKGQALATYLT